MHRWAIASRRYHPVSGPGGGMTSVYRNGGNAQPTGSAAWAHTATDTSNFQIANDPATTSTDNNHGRRVPRTLVVSPSSAVVNRPLRNPTSRKAAGITIQVTTSTNQNADRFA